MSINTILIIPGFGEQASDHEYRELKKRCERLPGTRAVLHTPRWDHRTAESWIPDAATLARRLDPKNLHIVGFSLGAYVALFLSELLPVSGASLCSLSPFFSETMPEIPTGTKTFLGKRRVSDFSKRGTPKHLKVEPTFYFGDQDWAMGLKTARALARRYGGRFVEIPKTGHELTQTYIDALVQNIAAAQKKSRSRGASRDQDAAR